MRSRTRQIHPEFFGHEGLSSLEFGTGLPLRIAYVGLWTVADMRGCFQWRPRALKRLILPDDVLDFGAVLDALESGGFVRRYSDDTDTYGVIPSFAKWQHFHHREKPDHHIPDPPRSLIHIEAPGEPRTSPQVSASASVSVSASAIPLKGPPYAGKGTEADEPDADSAAPPRRKKRRPSNSPLSRDTYADRVARGEA